MVAECLLSDGRDVLCGSIRVRKENRNKCDVSDAVFLHTCIVSAAVSSYR